MIVTREKGTLLSDTTMEAPVYINVKQEPFSLHGFSSPFRRVPEDVAEATSETVARLSKATAGGRVRFRTTSDFIVVHAEITEPGGGATSSFVATSSFDIFMKENGKYKFRGVFIPSQGEGKSYIEINKLTEFNLDYIPGDRKGKGGKITEVTLIVERKVDVLDASDKEEVSQEKLFELIDQVREVIKENISTTDIKMLVELSGYDIDKIKIAYEVFKEYNAKEPVESIPAFMRKAIRENWKPKKRTNTFSNIQQREENFDVLERLLLDN